MSRTYLYILTDFYSPPQDGTMKQFAWEVGGDALIREGIREAGVPSILLGCLVLSCYGVVVNLVRWDFSKLRMRIGSAVFCQGAPRRAMSGHSSTRD